MFLVPSATQPVDHAGSSEEGLRKGTGTARVGVVLYDPSYSETWWFLSRLPTLNAVPFRRDERKRSFISRRSTSISNKSVLAWYGRCVKLFANPYFSKLRLRGRAASLEIET